MKFNFATGWRPSVSLEDAITKTVEYYRCHKTHYW
jgi:nucleoside-diphosphate-sugar epimerase